MAGLQAICNSAATELRRFCKNDSGATAIEYSIIAVGIAVVLVLAVSNIGSSVKGTLDTVSKGM